eukprot:g1716.t1
MGDSVIDIDSEEEDGLSHAAHEAAHQAAQSALAHAQVRSSLVAQLTLPPSRGLTLPQLVGRAQLWLQEESLHFAPEEVEEEDELDLIIPVSQLGEVEAKILGPETGVLGGLSVILNLSPPLAANGFALDFMAEGHRISMLTLEAVEGDPFEALATFKTWLSSATCAEQCVTLHGPKSLGLVPRPHQKGFGLRFQGAVLEERDVDLLEDEQWFNDTIMDFFLRLAVEELYVAKTQFFTRLSAAGASSGEKGWENVRTWTRSVTGGLASQRVLIYPVNEANLHWCAFFVCHPYRVMRTDDTRGHMEDLPRMSTSKIIQGYLRRELFNTSGYGVQLEDSKRLEDKVTRSQMVARWKAAVCGLERMQAIETDVPKQQNVYDCGLYVLEFLLFLLRHPEKLTRLGLESHQAWFDQSTISHRRTQMRQLVVHLLQEGKAKGETDLSVLLKDQGLRARVHEALLSEPSPDEDLPWRPPKEPPPVKARPLPPPAVPPPVPAQAAAAEAKWWDWGEWSEDTRGSGSEIVDEMGNVVSGGLSSTGIMSAGVTEKQF